MRKDRATGAVSSLWWPRRPLATLGRKPRQGRKAATVSIDAGAEVSRRGYHPRPATLPAAWTHIACAMRPARHEHPRGTPRLPPASGPWLVVGTGRGDGARISTTAAPLRRVSIDAGAEVSRRGYHPPTTTNDQPRSQAVAAPAESNSHPGLSFVPAVATAQRSLRRQAMPGAVSRRGYHPSTTMNDQPRSQAAAAPIRKQQPPRRVIRSGRGDGTEILAAAGYAWRGQPAGLPPFSTTNDQPRSQAAAAPAASKSHPGVSFVPAVATAQRALRRQAMPGAVSRRGYHPSVRRHDQRLIARAATRVATPASPDAATPHRRRDNVRASRSVRAP
ncbi:hypothetical protein NB691_000270 [Xanthomonas sacchari]|nr:hypothetical protein [Xanthomonas sacchari]